MAIVFPFNLIEHDHVFMTLAHWSGQVNHDTGVASLDEYKP